MSDLPFPLNALHVCKDLAETNVTVELRAEVALLQAEKKSLGNLFKVLGQDPFFGVVLYQAAFGDLLEETFELHPEDILGDCPIKTIRESYDRDDWEMAAQMLELAGYHVEMTFATETTYSSDGVDIVPEKIVVSKNITEE